MSEHKQKDISLTLEGTYGVGVNFEIDNGPHGVALEINIDSGNNHIHTYLNHDQALELANKILEVLK